MNTSAAWWLKLDGCWVAGSNKLKDNQTNRISVILHPLKRAGTAGANPGRAQDFIYACHQQRPDTANSMNRRDKPAPSHILPRPRPANRGRQALTGSGSPWWSSRPVPGPAAGAFNRRVRKPCRRGTIPTNKERYKVWDDAPPAGNRYCCCVLLDGCCYGKRRGRCSDCCSKQSVKIASRRGRRASRQDAPGTVTCT